MIYVNPIDDSGCIMEYVHFWIEEDVIWIEEDVMRRGRGVSGEGLVPIGTSLCGIDIQDEGWWSEEALEEWGGPGPYVMPVRGLIHTANLFELLAGRTPYDVCSPCKTKLMRRLNIRHQVRGGYTP